ncbi:hypothetical protein CONPUDRAFT_170384 [Coniophora puteana RWD-64-598 SS2]|uniref:Uncharacterized protein n=1 Tax=Coniophora puteana (strain RWD-64-598) TaxID=741705 RepID=R7SDQ2_CONPW|nr:uncharacterized protein CONPUDRAFT_170384 [Coniophora puteana RWD-64-598 SS2]EIW74005.1 hypothetical protein CONPUDRAFT_170384 [Coniophora puteana RWD-64-598 SS2]
MVYGITNVFNYAPRHVSDASCVAYAWIVPLSEALGFTFLQLVMILRLYAMSNRSRPLLALLLVGYSVAQGILYTDTLRNAVDIGLTTTNRHPYGYGGLCLAESGNLIEPLLRGQYASLLAFEALMLVISLIFFVKHLKQSTGMLGRCSTRNMVVVLVRDNVLYFFVTAAIFAAESLSGKEVDWAPVDHVAFDVFNGVMSGFVVGIVGPHLILSILSNHAEATRGGPSIQLADLTTVNFSGGRTGLNDPLVSYVP